MVIKDAADEGEDAGDRAERTDMAKLLRGWATKEVGHNSNKTAAAADAAEDAETDEAEVVAEDAAAAAGNKTTAEETHTNQRRSSGTTTGTTVGHAGTMCPHGITAEPAPTAIPATSKAQQSKI